MNALSHTATSRVFPNRCSGWYTPELHGHSSTILIGACDSEPLVSGHTATSEPSSLAGLFPLRADSWFCWSNFVSLPWSGCDCSLVLQCTPSMLTVPWVRVASTLARRLSHCQNNQRPCNQLGCPWHVLGRLRIPDLALIWCWCLSTIARWDSVQQWTCHGQSYLWQVTVNFIVLCVLTLTLWIEFIFRFEPWFLIHSYELG